MEYRYEFAGQRAVVKVEGDGDGFLVSVGDRIYRVKASLPHPGELDLELDGQRRCLAYVAVDGANHWVALGPNADASLSQDMGHIYVLAVPDASRRPRRRLVARQGALEAQMPGIVRQVLVTSGQPVVRGQTLLLLEAMKMEMRIIAPHAGTVTRVWVTAGQSIDRGQTLIEVAPSPDPPG